MISGEQRPDSRKDFVRDPSGIGRDSKNDQIGRGKMPLRFSVFRQCEAVALPWNLKRIGYLFGDIAGCCLGTARRAEGYGPDCLNMYNISHTNHNKLAEEQSQLGGEQDRPA